MVGGSCTLNTTNRGTLEQLVEGYRRLELVAEVVDAECYPKRTETLKASHPAATEQFDKIDPDKWHENFLSRIDSAADSMPIFRHFGEEKHLVYKKTGDIDPEEQERFINKVRLQKPEEVPDTLISKRI